MKILLVLIAWAGDWAQLNQDALELLKAGRFADAERVVKQALDSAGDNQQRAVSHMNLGRIYRDWEHCADGARALERGVQLFEKSGDRLVTMEAASQLVALFLECGAPDRGLAVQNRYVDLKLARSSLPPARLSQVLGNAGVILMQRRKYKDAEPLLLEALSLARPIDQAVLHGTLAQLYLEQKNFTDALRHTQQSLALTESELGLEHPLAVKCLANLAVVYARLGDHANADLFHGRALGLAMRYYPPDSPLVADILDNRAKMQREQGKKQEARVMEDRARAIRALQRRDGLTESLSVLERQRN